MSCSCCRPPRVWATHTGQDGKLLAFHLKPGEPLPIRSRSFALHLGPLVMVEAQIGEDGASVALREIAEG